MKLVLLDLDNTLLRSDKSISAYTIEILHKCQAADRKVAFCTARGESNILPFIDAVHPDMVIASNGALVRYQGKILYYQPLSVSDTQALINKGLELTGHTCEITVDTLSAHYWNRKIVPGEFPDWGQTVYTDFRDFKEESLKLCIEISDAALAGQIAQSVPACNCVPFSDIAWYSFSNKNATKEKAIAAVSQSLHIPFSEMIAFGDDYGDIGMLRLAGRGIAMDNAIPEVKAAADAITDSNDNDGVAKYLEKLL